MARKPGRPSRDEAATLDALVIDRTLEALRSIGFAELTIDRIAAEVGVTKRTLYRRFGTKEALIEAVASREFGRLGLDDSLRDGDATEPLEALRALCHSHFVYMLQPGNRAFKNFLTVDMTINAGDPERPKRWFKTFVGPWCRLIEAAQAAGQLMPGDPMEIALIMFDLIDAALQRLRDGMGAELAFGQRSPDAFFQSRWDAFLTLCGPSRATDKGPTAAG